MKNPFRIPNHPLIMAWDDWDQWEADAKKQYPVRFFLTKTLPIGWARFKRRFFVDPYYEVRAFFRPFNVVKVRSLPRTYCERDLLLLHAAFQILWDFVDREQPSDFTLSEQELLEAYTHRYDGEETVMQDRIDSAMKLRELYAWWQKAKNYDDLDQWDDPTYSYDACNEKLHQLIDIRGSLWT